MRKIDCNDDFLRVRNIAVIVLINELRWRIGMQICRYLAVIVQINELRWLIGMQMCRLVLIVSKSRNQYVQYGL